MTPEEAQYLELGTTPGPWEAYDPGDGTARMYAGEVEEARPLLHNVDSDPHTACVYVTREDGNLIAAAPDMRATISAQTWEYRVEEFNEPYWHPITKWSDEWPLHDGHTPFDNERVVRRPVGPVEVVE